MKFKVKSHPYQDGTLQHCTVCGYCRPRWWGDRVDINEGKVICPCGKGKMEIREGKSIDYQQENAHPSDGESGETDTWDRWDN